MSAEVRVGRGFRDFLIEKISNARNRVIVVSPWVSPEYVEILLELRSRGVDVKLITSDDTIPSHREALKRLIVKREEVVEKGNEALVAIGLFFFIASFMLFFINIVLGFIAFVLSLIFIIAGGGKYKTYYISVLGENLVVYPARILHAKIYIVDETVGIGSINLTSTGIENNYEAFIWVKDHKIVEEVIKSIEEMGRLLRRIDIDEVGEKIYGTKTR